MRSREAGRGKPPAGWLVVLRPKRLSANRAAFSSGGAAASAAQRAAAASRVTATGHVRLILVPGSWSGNRSARAGWSSQSIRPTGTSGARHSLAPGSHLRSSRRSMAPSAASFSERVPRSRVYRTSAGSAASRSPVRTPIQIATGVWMANTFSSRRVPLPSPPRSITHTSSHTRRRCSRIPRNPGPVR